MKPINPRMTAALLSVFKPLARLLMIHDIDAKTVIEIIKKAFVDVAGMEYGRNGKFASISKTAATTGLTRREVRRLKSLKLDFSSNSDFYGAAEADILGLWIGRAEFLDNDGQPRELDFGPGEGSFSDLVTKAIGSVSPLTYLSRLSETQCVAVDSEGKISLARRHWPMGNDLAKMIGGSLGPLAMTMSKNWGKPPEDGLCQRTAYSVRIDPSKVDTFRRIARERIENFVQEIDDYFIGFESDRPQPFLDRDGVELVRMGVGAYYYEIDR